MRLKFNVAKCVAVIMGKCCTSVTNFLIHNQALPWSEGLGELGAAFKVGNNLPANISVRSQKFIGSVALVLRGRVFVAEDVYIKVIKTKCMSLLFYGVDCLRVDAHATEKLSIIWNTAFRWVLSVRRSENLRNKLI